MDRVQVDLGHSLCSIVARRWLASSMAWPKSMVTPCLSLTDPAPDAPLHRLSIGFYVKHAFFAQLTDYWGVFLLSSAEPRNDDGLRSGDGFQLHYVVRSPNFLSNMPRPGF